MRDMKLLKLCLIIAGTIGFAVSAFAGWVQIDQEGTTTLISDGMLKGIGAGDDQYSILDAKKGNITFVDSKRRIYARESIEDFCDAVITGMNKMKANKPQAEREKQKFNKDVPLVSVVSEGDGGVIAGFSTVKYRVLTDGKLYEEVWLTRDPAVMKDLESLFRTVMKKFETCLFSVANVADSLPLTVEETPEYKKLEQAGWQMKSMNHSGSAGPVTRSIVKLEKIDIPAAEFEVPAGFKKTPILEMLFREN
jgi:hypothetical protein